MNITVTQKQVGQESIQTINARELHAFLGVGRDFSSWMSQRIKKYEFIENHDFIILPQSGENYYCVGRPSIEYHLTLDMAKELSMVENSDKGREARQYFIRCEKNLKAALQAPSKPEAFVVLGGYSIKDLEQAARLHRSIKAMGRSRGLSPAQQIEQADAVVLSATGIDLLKLLDIPESFMGKKTKNPVGQIANPVFTPVEPSLVEPKRGILRGEAKDEGDDEIHCVNHLGQNINTRANDRLNVTALASMCGMKSPIAMNTWLMNHGFQKKITSQSLNYELTGINGEKYGVKTTVPRRQESRGGLSDFLQIQWLGAAVPFIINLMKKEAEEERAKNHRISEIRSYLDQIPSFELN